MTTKEYKIAADQLFHIEQALVMYIDYLRDGDDDDKETAKKVEKIYDYIKEKNKEKKI